MRRAENQASDAPGRACTCSAAGTTDVTVVGGSDCWPGGHICSPSQRWPHQQMPSALIMQVPLPQQRVSSFVIGHLNLIVFFACAIVEQSFLMTK